MLETRKKGMPRMSKSKSKSKSPVQGENKGSEGSTSGESNPIGKAKKGAQNGKSEATKSAIDEICPPMAANGQVQVLSTEDLGKLWEEAVPLMESKLEIEPRRLLMPIELIDAWAMNPNEQDTHTFNLLVKKIKEQYADPETMDQAIHVCPNPESRGRFIVFSGNHRLKAVKFLGGVRIQATLFFWPLQKVIEEAVSDNLVKGSTNSEKFTKLVNWYANKWKVSVEDIAPKWGFQKEAEFYKNYKRAQTEQLKKLDDQIKTESKDKLQKIENLSFVLNKLFREYGSTLDQEFMFFMFGDKLHMMVWMDAELQQSVKRIGDFAFENKVDVSLLFRRIVAESIEKLDQLAAELKA